jgi:hypothetical protein
MGHSYGYNREEDAWDYNSAQSLIIALIDKVSRGGNFLLDIGPDEHGKIPPIMQERLLQIGEWLNINGEAIYNTRRWKMNSQWSDGKRDWNGNGDIMLKLTVDPDPGFAIKEVFYTYDPTNNNLFAIFPKYPDNKKLVLKDVALPAETKISFLSTKENLQWRQIEKNVEISLPEYNPNKIMSPYAYAVKMENFGRFASKPVIQLDYSKDAMKPTVTINTDIGTLIYYTTDGSEPSQSSKIYNGPFTAEKTLTLKALAIMGGSGENYASLIPSAIVTAEIKTYEWKNPLKVSATKPGIAFRYFEPTGKIDLSSINNNPAASGIATIISHQNKKRANKFAFEFTGYIKIEKDAVHTFFTDSDDGSMLYIDDEVVVNNDGDHGNVEKSGKAALKKGFHKIKVVYFDSGGGNSLRVSLQPEGGKKEVIPAALLFH